MCLANAFLYLCLSHYSNNATILKNFFKNIFLFFNLLAVLGLIGSYLSIRISPANWWMPAFFGLAYPYLLLANILFILLWLFTKTRYALISFLAIAIGYHHLTHYFQFKGSETEEAGITILSYNIKNFYADKTINRNEAASRILTYIQSKSPDIICLQEISTSNQKSFHTKPNSSGESPFFKNVHFSKRGGQATYSRFPIIYKDEVHFEKTGNMILLSDLKIDQDTIRVFNCHLQSYRFSDEDINSLDSISLNKQQESYRQVRYTGSKLKQAFIKRAEQAETLHQLVSESPYQVFVCGDFNDTPVSYTYHTVIQGLEDAFVNSGQGIGNTYLGKLPSFRIDYILHSSTYQSFNFEVDRVTYSDHYPISCVLRKKNQ